MSTARMRWLLAACVALLLACGGGAEHGAPDHDHEHGHGDGRTAPAPHDDDHAGTAERVVVPDDMLTAAGIAVATAGPDRIVATIDLPGEVTLDQDRLAHVVPRLAGVVAEVHASLGDRVQRGQVLAAIDSRELAEVKSEFIEAVHLLELKQAMFLREDRLFRRRITPEIDHLTAKHELEEAEIRRQIGEQKLRALGVGSDTLAALSAEPAGRVVDRRVRMPFADQALTRFELTAPLDGTVIEKHLTVGEAVAADADAFVVADLSSMWIDVAVGLKDVGRVAIGQTVAIRAPAGGPEASAHVDWVGPVVAAESRSALARIVVENPALAWRAGMFVTVSLTAADETVAVAIPVDAVQSHDGASVVFVRDGDDFVPRPVVVGRRARGLIEITAGLAAGERYAAGGAFVLAADLAKSEAAHEH